MPLNLQHSTLNLRNLRMTTATQAIPGSSGD